MAASNAYKFVFAFSILLCFLGVLLSLYAYYVETTKEKDSSYIAFCDFSSSMSCSKVFTSKYGRGFGILEYFVGRKHWLNQPNSVFGMMYYALQVILSFQHTVTAAVIQCNLGVLANLGSIYLAYILYFVLEDFCIVCVSTYIINAFLLIMNFGKRRLLMEATKRGQKWKSH